MRWNGLMVGAALLASSTLALAQMGPGGGGPGMGGGGMMGGRAMQQFQALDTNKDGNVSAEEFKAAHAKTDMLTMLDANEDGVVTKEEFTSGGGPRRAARFADLDRDSDGKLSQAEIDAFTGDMFAMMDDNGDGQISQTEFVPGRMR